MPFLGTEKAQVTWLLLQSTAVVHNANYTHSPSIRLTHDEMLEVIVSGTLDLNSCIMYNVGGYSWYMTTSTRRERNMELTHE